jgi:hypothetical protein
VIVSLHVATGAAAGSLLRSRLGSLPLGLLLHLAGDLMPHEDIFDREFEVGSGSRRSFCSPLFEARSIPQSPVRSRRQLRTSNTLFAYRAQAAASSFQVIAYGWHQSGGVPAPLQLLTAGFLIGLLLRRGSLDGRDAQAAAPGG